MIDGYARVLTDAQDLSNQATHPKAAGSGSILREKISTPYQQKEARARVEADEPQRNSACGYSVSQAMISR